MAETIVIRDDATRAEIEEAITNVNATLHRMPAHWTDRRAALHDKINALLDDRDHAPA